MKNLQILALATLFIATGIESLQAKVACVKGKEWRNGACRTKVNKPKSGTALVAVNPDIANLSGQALIDALNAKNMTLAADIKKLQEHNHDIKKDKGKRLGVGKNTGKMVSNMTKEQRNKIKSNNKQIAKNRQQISNNNMKIAETQKALKLAVATQAKNGFMSYLQGNSSRTDIDLEDQINQITTAYYNQGAADQYNTDTQTIQDAYNQGYADGQNGIDYFNDSESTVAASGYESASKSMTSSCSDGSTAYCQDNTDLSQALCEDGTAPDSNGVCSDGSLVMCNDGMNIPLCADGNFPM